MTKWKKQKKVVGTLNFEKKAIANPLIEIIISFQKQLQDKEDLKRKNRRHKISFVYASLELSKNIKK